MALAYLETTCPNCGRELVACFCAHTNHQPILDPTTIDTMPKEQFIRFIAVDLEAYVREGHTYREWVNTLTEEYGIPHSLACDIMDEVKERKGMIRTHDDVLVCV